MLKEPNKQYVIWLTSNPSYDVCGNAYGYWQGKNYTAIGELIPVCDSKITDYTKRYTSKLRADKALESCMNRGYSYVFGGEVREVS